MQNIITVNIYWLDNQEFSSVQSLGHVRLFATPWSSDSRPPCASPTPKVYSNSCPWSQWWHPTTSSSVIPFYSGLQSFPALGSLQISQYFESGGQSIGVSASASVLPMNTQDWFPLEIDWFELLAVQGTLKCLLKQHHSKASILRYSAFFIVQLSHPYMTTGKTIALTRQTFVGKVTSLFFNMLFLLWLKTQHAENEDHGIWSHHFMGNRWGNSGNSVRLYFLGLQNHCRWWLQPWN